MDRFIRDRYGRDIGRASDRGNVVEYYLLGRGGSLIGIWHKNTNEFIAYGAAGSGLVAQSDIGAGLVYELWNRYDL